MKIKTSIALLCLGIFCNSTFAQDIKESTNAADITLLQLIYGGEREFKHHLNMFQNPPIPSLKSKYPSVPDSFWEEYKTLRTKQFVTNSLETIRQKLTPEQFDELRKFAISPAGRAVISASYQVKHVTNKATHPYKEIKKREGMVEDLLVKKGFANAVSRKHCLGSQMVLSSAIHQYAMEKNIKDLDQISFEMVTPYLKNKNIPVCPDGGKYTYDSTNQTVKCSIADHKRYIKK
jgi:hypothetical protein